MMSQLRMLSKILVILVVVAALGVVFFSYYHLIFQKTVRGEVIGVERVDVPMAIVSQAGENPSKMVFSFAVSIRDEKSGEIFVASSEDRRWAVVQKGQCAEAVFYPYGPWELSKGSSYFNARLERLFDNCEKASGK